MTLIGGAVRISDFERDEGNVLHLELGHGITPEEAEEVFAHRPLFKRTKKKHYAAFGLTAAARYLTIIFESKPRGIVRVITGWDMKRSEIQYYRRNRR